VPGPFYTTLRHLIQAYPADWISFLGLAEPGKVDVIDANVSTVTAEVDKVMRVGGASPWLVHLEFQSSYDPTMGQRLVRYNTMFHVQHQLPVRPSWCCFVRQLMACPSVASTRVDSRPVTVSDVHV
jgi:hypothetical protein